jgi:hypothetical protein
VGDNFERNIFINCPFDSDYKPLLRALIFTILICGLEPRIALERDDCGEERIDKIKDLIKNSKYSIHDISRMESLKKGDLPRFNLPFELGLDMGCRTYGEGRLATKKSLILEKELHRFRAVISDISGNDIRAHNSDVKELIRNTRNWLRTITNANLHSAGHIWNSFNIFSIHLIEKCRKEEFEDKDIEEMPISEYIYFIIEWLKKD